MSERRRLGVQDALWLEMDGPGNLMVVDYLFWTPEPIDWGSFHGVLKERLWDRFQVFRSVVVRGEDRGWYWEELPDADLEDRYRHLVLPAPGGDAELQAVIASQRTVPLDRREPLWQAVLVDGFHGGSAVLFRAHHAIADGIRMVQLTLSVMDTTPDGTATPGGGPREPGPEAPSPSRTTDTLLPLTRTTSTLLPLTRSIVTNPVGAAHSVLARSGSLLGAAGSSARSAVGLVPIARPGLLAVLSGVPGDLDTVRKLVLGTRNDTTLWSGTVGENKTIAWSTPLLLDEVKYAAHAHAATVNDVLVTCVAESLRLYLDQHRAVCHSVTWDIPVNMKPFDPALPVELGNSFALVQLELPTNIDDPTRTLKVLRRRMGRIKRGHEAMLDFGLQAVISRLDKRLYRASIELLANRSIGVLTNVPGPQMPLYIAGQRVLGMMGWAPLTADQVMSLTICSYDGKVFVGLAADAGLVPDPWQIVDNFAHAFRRLSLLA